MLKLGLLTKKQLETIREKFKKEWEDKYFSDEEISLDERRRRFEDQNGDTKIDAVGCVYRSIMLELEAAGRLNLNRVSSYKARSKIEVRRWMKQIIKIEPIRRIIEEFDLTTHVLRVKHMGENYRTVKIILIDKAKDEGFIGGLNYFAYEIERLREERKVAKFRSVQKE